jgi:predicted nucleic acid-binding protein
MLKKVFLDTNIVADIIDAQRVHHQSAMRLVEKLIDEAYDICISEDMLSTLFYISKDKKGTLDFFQNVIFEDWEILHFGHTVVRDGVATALKEALDLEDVLQCLCAKNHGCDTIVTNDMRFYNCGIRIVSAEAFLV